MQLHPDPFLIPLFSKLRDKGKGDSLKPAYENMHKARAEDFSFGFGGVAEIIREQGLSFMIDETKLGILSIGKTQCLPRMGNHGI